MEIRFGRSSHLVPFCRQVAPRTGLRHVQQIAQPSSQALAMRRPFLAAIASAVLVSCGGGGGSDGGSDTPSTPSTFVISGSVSGLGSGKQVTLLNNSGNPATVTANGSFSFSNPIARNGNYAVTVGTQPTGQVCTVTNGTGTGIVANVSNVQVACTDAAFSVSGTVSGLGAGKQLVLKNNLTDSVTILASGTFRFDTTVPLNGSYSVTVGSQPTGQMCAVQNGTGTGVTANVSNVQVTCTDIANATYSISGSVSGLGAGKQLVLQNNLTDPITISTSGNFSFNNNVPLNGSYSVTVRSQPTGQVCTVANGSGSGVTANVSNVRVTCSDNSYSIGGTLSGLGSGLQVTVRNNGANATTLTTNGSFAFSAPIAYGGSYSVTVGTQPTGQSCTVTNGSGSGVVSNVTNVQVSCADVIRGWVTTRLSQSGDSGAVGAVVQPDGKIVVVGGAENGPAFDDFAVARYNSDGSLDTSFSADGLVLTNIFGRTASTDWVRGVALQADGKIVVAGYTTEGGSDTYGLAVARYNSDGSLDSTFSTDGIVTKYDASGARNMFGHAIAVQPDGKLVVAGAINCVSKVIGGYCTLLARFNSDGSFDAVFDTAFTPDSSTKGAVGLVLQGDRKILVAGTRDSGSGDGFSVARYNDDGSLDTSFGAGGVATAFISSEVGSRDSGSSIALQPDGKIIVAGTTYTLSANNHFGVARFLSNGNLDASFGVSGVLTTNISGGAKSDNAASVAVQPDGKILVGGDMLFVRSDPFPYPGFYSAANVDFALVRYNSNGSLDTSFGSDGIVTTDFRLLTDIGRNVIVQPNGAILISGSSFTHDPSDTVSGGYGSFAIARYNANGSPDQTFGNGAD